MKRLLLFVFIALVIPSCGPEEGPLGMHVGDSILGDWRYSGEVTAFGKDWVEVDQYDHSNAVESMPSKGFTFDLETGYVTKRFSADQLTNIGVDCPHK